MTDTPPTRIPSLQECRDKMQNAVQYATGVNQPSLLVRATAPAIYLYRTRRTRSVQSRQGGQPRGVTRWPHFEGRPQWFLLGIRLSELQNVDHGGLLPPEGWLNFFIAPDVLKGEGPLNACTVTFTPDENAPALRPPTQDLLNKREALVFEWGIQSQLEEYEFATPEEYNAACAELEMLKACLAKQRAAGHRPDNNDPFIKLADTVHRTDYLLGKQINANDQGYNSWEDAPGFMRELHGRPDTRLQALLSLTEYRSDWPFLDEEGVLSLTFFIEESDLKARRFDRVIVDVITED